MPEVLGNPPSPRTALFWNGTAWQWALVDAAGHLQIDTVTSALPAGAATAAAQALALAQLQLIEDMRDALQSVATDRLQVRGEDQLFSYALHLGYKDTFVISGADGFVDSAPVPAGEIWVVSNIVANDLNSPTTAHLYYQRFAGVNHEFNREIAAFPAGVPSIWRGHLYLGPGDVFRASFTGGLAADQCMITLTGYKMTLET